MTSSEIRYAKDLISFLKEKLKAIYESHEAENISFLIGESFFSITKTDYVLNNEIEKIDTSILDQVLIRLLNHEPIQHVIGMCEFYGLEFRVNSDVLIPRPETEELVDLIIQKYKGQKDLKIIDYCTGSGCIAISLAKHLDAQMTAVDVSDKALEIARLNAQSNGVDIDFLEKDLLTSTFNFQPSTFDFIVSNPPYVLESEKSEMSANVLKYDPHLALFVDDDQALIFYDRIADLAYEQLKRGGELFFEINERFGYETEQLLLEKGFESVVIHHDLQGKPRMVSAKLL